MRRRYPTIGWPMCSMKPGRGCIWRIRSGVKGFAYRRVKNDFRDAADLADLLRMGRLPEAWIAPPPVRAHRELVRHRHKLRQLCSGIKAGAHAVLAKNALFIPRSDMFGLDGRRRLSALNLPEGFRLRLA